jgi:aspartyl-tRNA(Asn)/glutamyl-tRNA(Gln) amidotransferase subunit B
LQEGSFRCDANVSVRPRGETKLGTRTELKNLNSFRFVEKAIETEAARQIEILEAGGKIDQETRLYDPDRDETRPMRSKEEANDYRYFPDPDLLPIVIEEAEIDTIAAALPELPDAKRARFGRDYGLSTYDAGVLTAQRALADYYEVVARSTSASAKIAANWVMGELAAALHRDNLEIGATRLSAPTLAALLDKIASGAISGKIGKEIFEALWTDNGTGGAPAVAAIIDQRGLAQISDSASIDKLVAEVIAANPTQVEQYRAGKQQVLGFLVGQVMKASRGKANPQQVNEALRKALGG